MMCHKKCTRQDLFNMLDVFIYGTGIKQNVHYDKSADHVSNDVTNAWNMAGDIDQAIWHY